MKSNSLACPICESHAFEIFSVSNYPIAACRSCTHKFATTLPRENHVAEQFSDEYFFGGGTSGYQDYLSSAKLVKVNAKRYTELVHRHCSQIRETSAVRVLDVGCAAGFVMEGFGQAGWHSTGIDPNQKMVERSRSSGFDRHRETLESVLDGATLLDQRDGYFDLISMIQVVAHLSDIGKAAGNLRQLLRDNGYVLVETWDSASMTAKILGKNWHEYSPPNVLHYFSKNSLDKFFADAGFSFVAGGHPTKRINLGHARSLFEFKYGGSRLGKTMAKASRLVSDDVTFPYPAEDLVWRIYQKETA